MKIGDKILTWKDLCTHRSLWMGVAMLWVIMCHVPITYPLPFLNFIKDIGYGGVDLFMFASGLGLYHSLSRDRNPLRFLERRIIRLAPIYLPFTVVWLLYLSLYIDVPFISVLGNLLALEGFSGHGMYFNWFIPALVAYYFLAPYLFELVERTNSLRQLCALVASALLFTYVFWDNHDAIIVVTRIPIFLIGMYVAKISAAPEGKTVSPLAVFLLLLLSIAGVAILYFLKTHYDEDFLWVTGLSWYPFILITPGLCILLSILAELLEPLRFLNWLLFVLTKIGEYSFEAFLIHLLLLDIYRYRIIPAIPAAQNALVCVAVFLMTVPLSIILHWVAKKIRPLFVSLFERPAQQDHCK